MNKQEPIKAINWNEIPDPFDKQIWDKLTSQFWLPEAISLSDDIKSWNTLTNQEQWLVLRVFTSLTLLDTLQAEFGALSLIEDAQSKHEVAWLLNVAFMEEVHAKSYSTIFQTLATSEQIRRAFRWAEENEYLQKKANIIKDYYTADNAPLKKKVASTFLESFLFFSGFYLPFYLVSQGKLLNSGDIVRLITRDESIHGMAIGKKFQDRYNVLSVEEQEELKLWAYELLDDLYENECSFVEELYDEFELTEDVKKFLRYNANKALQNLGFDSLFPHEDVNPLILNGLSLGSETHDFFSSKGSTYTIGKAEAMTEDDWNIGEDDEF